MVPSGTVFVYHRQQTIGLPPPPFEGPPLPEHFQIAAQQPIVSHPLPHGNAEAGLAAGDGIGRDQPPGGALYNGFRFQTGHLYGGGQLGSELNDTMVQEGDAGLESRRHGHLVHAFEHVVEVGGLIESQRSA